MGESACLMHQQQPFCYASGISNEPNESNLIHALGQSISFGRFGAESLAWEKWSTFSHNRYVEEAERYSRPGSVAEKKAFFEAHYKKLAAQKAAALLEQANNAASNNVTDQEHNEAADNTPDSQSTRSSSELVHNEEQDIQVVNSEPNAILCKNSSDSNSNIPENNSKAEEYQALMGKVTDQEYEEVAHNTHDFQATNPTFKLVHNEEQEVEIVNFESNAMFSDHGNYSRPYIAENNRIEEYQALLGNSMKDELHNQLEDVDTQEDASEKHSANYEDASMSNKKQGVSSLNSLKSTETFKLKSTPAKPVSHKKENTMGTPLSSNKPSSVDKKRSTVSFTPIREFNRLTASVMRKFEGARVGVTSSKASKDSSTPLRTPTMASKNQLRKHPSMTPLTEKKRNKTPVGSLASGSNTAGPKWRLLSTENKVKSPMISSPFSLRTEERAARRKKKLEEKFNANEAQKVQLHTKLKEKAETELRRLRQSFCFKARPLPDFYKERKVLKNEINKCQLTHPESPKQGKKLTPRRVWSKTCVTPQKSTVKNNGAKNWLEKNDRSSVHHLTSNPRMIAQENTSPNIQHRNQNDSNSKKITQRLEQNFTRQCQSAENLDH